VVNHSSRIVLMIDEAHRTQRSNLGDNIFEAFPNAARIAFTVTPLITERHGEKKTVKRFGDYIDTYRLMDAVEDGTTLQILYEGCKQGEEGMSKEATTFYEHIANEAFENGEVPVHAKPKMKTLMEAIVETLQHSIGSIDFWHNSDKQKKTRSEIKTALTLTGIAELKENREHIAIEIMKLAKNRHDELLKGTAGSK
jgi:type I site-specific restriction-modification system R (restriction) subunit